MRALPCRGEEQLEGGLGDNDEGAGAAGQRRVLQQALLHIHLQNRRRHLSCEPAWQRLTLQEHLLEALQLPSHRCEQPVVCEVVQPLLLHGLEAWQHSCRR